MQKRHYNREQYFHELASSSEKYYLPYLKQHLKIRSEQRILEVGCGEGGNLLPFAQIGCQIAGLDGSTTKIINANKFFNTSLKTLNMGGGKNSPLKFKFFCENFLSPELKIDQEEPFDIILIHDVIEHIEPEDKHNFFLKVKKYMRPNAVVFWRFPAWHMPFGGHQQICRSKILSKIPFLHLLPLGIYRRLLQLAKEEPYILEDLISIRRSQMTIENFEKLCHNTGHKILDRTLWLINPHYHAKFKLTPRKLPAILNIPHLRNYFTTSCFFITRVQ